jgi:hypothetical protein
MQFVKDVFLRVHSFAKAVAPTTLLIKGLFVSTYRLYNLDYNLNYIICRDYNLYIAVGWPDYMN